MSAVDLGSVCAPPAFFEVRCPDCNQLHAKIAFSSGDVAVEIKCKRCSAMEARPQAFVVSKEGPQSPYRKQEF